MPVHPSRMVSLRKYCPSFPLHIQRMTDLHVFKDTPARARMYDWSSVGSWHMVTGALAEAWLPRLTVSSVLNTEGVGCILDMIRSVGREVTDSVCGREVTGPQHCNDIVLFAKQGPPVVLEIVLTWSQCFSASPGVALLKQGICKWLHGSNQWLHSCCSTTVYAKPL
jgi:hypothetical protein